MESATELAANPMLGCQLVAKSILVSKSPTSEPPGCNNNDQAKQTSTTSTPPPAIDNSPKAAKNKSSSSHQCETPNTSQIKNPTQQQTNNKQQATPTKPSPCQNKVISNNNNISVTEHNNNNNNLNGTTPNNKTNLPFTQLDWELLSKENQDIKNHKRKLQDELEEHREIIRDITDELDKAKKQNETYERDIRKLNLEIKKLHQLQDEYDELKSRESDYEKLQLETNRLKDKLAELELSQLCMNEIKLDRSQAQEDCAQLEEKLKVSEAKLVQIVELEKQLVKWRSIGHELELERDSLQCQLLKSIDEETKLNSMYKQADEEVKRLRLLVKSYEDKRDEDEANNSLIIINSNQNLNPNNTTSADLSQSNNHLQVSTSNSSSSSSPSSSTSSPKSNLSGLDQEQLLGKQPPSIKFEMDQRALNDENNSLKCKLEAQEPRMKQLDDINKQLKSELDSNRRLISSLRQDLACEKSLAMKLTNRLELFTKQLKNLDQTYLINNNQEKKQPQRMPINDNNNDNDKSSSTKQPQSSLKPTTTTPAATTEATTTLISVIDQSSSSLNGHGDVTISKAKPNGSVTSLLKVSSPDADKLNDQACDNLARSKTTPVDEKSQSSANSKPEAQENNRSKNLNDSNNNNKSKDDATGLENANRSKPTIGSPTKPFDKNNNNNKSVGADNGSSSTPPTLISTTKTCNGVRISAKTTDTHKSSSSTSPSSDMANNISSNSCSQKRPLDSRSSRVLHLSTASSSHSADHAEEESRKLARPSAGKLKSTDSRDTASHHHHQKQLPKVNDDDDEDDDEDDDDDDEQSDKFEVRQRLAGSQVKSNFVRNSMSSRSVNIGHSTPQSAYLDRIRASLAPFQVDSTGNAIVGQTTAEGQPMGATVHLNCMLDHEHGQRCYTSDLKVNSFEMVPSDPQYRAQMQQMMMQQQQQQQHHQQLQHQRLQHQQRQLEALIDPVSRERFMISMMQHHHASSTTSTSTTSSAQAHQQAQLHLQPQAEHHQHGVVRLPMAGGLSEQQLALHQQHYIHHLQQMHQLHRMHHQMHHQQQQHQQHMTGRGGHHHHHQHNPSGAQIGQSQQTQPAKEPQGPESLYSGGSQFFAPALQLERLYANHGSPAGTPVKHQHHVHHLNHNHNHEYQPQAQAQASHRGQSLPMATQQRHQHSPQKHHDSGRKSVQTHYYGLAQIAEVNGLPSPSQGSASMAQNGSGSSPARRLVAAGRSSDESTSPGSSSSGSSASSSPPTGEHLVHHQERRRRSGATSGVVTASSGNSSASSSPNGGARRTSSDTLDSKGVASKHGHSKEVVGHQTVKSSEQMRGDPIGRLATNLATIKLNDSLAFSSLRVSKPASLQKVISLKPQQQNGAQSSGQQAPASLASSLKRTMSTTPDRRRPVGAGSRAAGSDQPKKPSEALWFEYGCV